MDTEVKTGWVSHVTIGFGVDLYTLFIRSSASPVGFVWGFTNRNPDGVIRFETMGSSTVEWAKRRGVRTRINDALFEEFGVDVIASPGSSESGAAFMRDYGYTYDKPRSTWTITKRQRKRALKQKQG